MMPFQSSNPIEQLIALASGHWVSRAVWLAARLKIADAIQDGALNAAAIAAATGTRPERVDRLMKALASIGLFEAREDGRYAQGALSPFLRSDHPISQRAFIDAVYGGVHYDAWGNVEASLREEATAFDHLFGKPAFGWFGDHPEVAELFSRAMEGTSRLIEAALLACWQAPAFELAVDVGGSRGALLAALLAQRPEARGILFDLPEIVGQVADALPDRVEAVGGNFFESLPEGDLYLLKLILHDWTDDQSETILRNVRAAIRPGGRIAIVETILPEQVGPHPGYLMDLNMMVMTGGRERTAAEFEAMLARTGFKVESVTPLPMPIGVVQGVAV